MDQIIRAISGDGYVSCAAISSRETAERARAIHSASRTATAALGRALAAAVMLAHPLKNDNASVTLRISGGGPVGTVIAVATPDGAGRCCASNPEADVPPRRDGKLDVGALVGTDGMISVIRDEGAGEPYAGSAELVSGEIAEDLTQYLTVSEQLPSAVALGVLVGGDGAVRAAGGYIVSMLPGAPDDERDRIADILERNIAAAGAVTARLAADPDPWALARLVLDGLEPKLLCRAPTEYRCTCSRERVLAALAGIGADEARDILEKGEPVEATCRFCDARYLYEPDEIAGNYS